jgi:hypothetical protein
MEFSFIYVVSFNHGQSCGSVFVSGYVLSLYFSEENTIEQITFVGLFLSAAIYTGLLRA